MNTYYVELNFSGSNTIDTGIAVSQGDYGKVQLSIACKKDGQFISDAESAEIIFQTEKGKVINGDLTGSGGLYGYVFQGNELQDPGKLVATVTLHYEDGQTSSESFLMAVRYNPLYDQNLQAGPYITQLEKLQAQAQGYVDYIGAIIEQLRQDIGETALTKADLQNDFLQSAPGLKALDAALGPQILQKSNVVNNLLATVTGNVLDATQGKALNEKITQLYSDMLQPITLSSTGITYDENYVDSSGTTISVYKMGRLVIITGSMRFAGEPFSNNVLIRNLPVSCWQTRFGLTSYVTNASQVFGVLGGDSINMSGSPVSSREYRFCFATFSNS